MMRNRKTWKTLLAAALSIAIAVVFVPAFGQVDKASAKTIEKMEIVSTEGFELSLDDATSEYPSTNLDSHEYENGQGDILRITFDEGEPVDYYCVDSAWDFESQDGEESISVIVLNTWANPPEEPDTFVVGQSYGLKMQVYDASEGTGITGNPYLQDLPVTIVETTTKVEDIKLTLKSPLQLSESATGLYSDDDVVCSKGDELEVIYDDEDGTSVTFVADENGDFLNNNNESAPLYFKWKKDEGVTVDENGDLKGEAGGTYNLYYFTYKVMDKHTSGTEVYGYDYVADDWDYVPVTIADHDCTTEYTWSSDNKSVTATSTCKVCGDV